MNSFDFMRVALHTRFCKALGPPHAMQGDGTQWSFEPNLTPRHAQVHIVVTGSGPPAVWIFDPSHAADGLEYMQIRDVKQIDPIIQSILNRIKLPIPRPVVPRANAPGRDYDSANCNPADSNSENKRLADFRAANHHSNGSATGLPPDQKQASA